MEHGGASDSIGTSARLASRVAGAVGILAFGAWAAHAQAPPRELAADAIVAAGETLVDGAAVAYVSDYISFAGTDDVGRVLFALDTNRGRTDGEYQGEHFVAMYAENEGWIELEGYSEFPNEEGALLAYPESPWFRLTGAPFALESLESESNDLAIDFGPLTPRVSVGDDNTRFALASGPATLRWRGRVITGRVIYEFLAMRGENRLAGQGLGGLWRMVTDGPDFQGLYLASGDDDFYAHLALSSAASTLSEPLMAFWARAGRTMRIRNLSFEVTAYTPALGFYRWPTSWELNWQSDCGDARMSVETLDHATQTNWVVGGFGMRAVVGRFECGAESAEFIGFGELIR